MKKELLISLGNRMRRGNRGFTLIELMVVIVILGILAGLIIPRIMGRPDEARQTKARIQIEGIETALKLDPLDNGSYPTTEQGLRALVEPPGIPPVPRNWREGGYLEKGKLIKDPWGNDFAYLCPGTHGEFDLRSYRADEEQGGDGKHKEGLAPGSPAERAGVQPGDTIVAVGDDRVTAHADLLRRTWRRGPAGTTIPLLLARQGTPVRVSVHSADRSDFLKKPSLQ